MPEFPAPPKLELRIVNLRFDASVGTNGAIIFQLQIRAGAGYTTGLPGGKAVQLQGATLRFDINIEPGVTVNLAGGTVSSSTGFTGGYSANSTPPPPWGPPLGTSFTSNITHVATHLIKYDWIPVETITIPVISGTPGAATTIKIRSYDDYRDMGGDSYWVSVLPGSLICAFEAPCPSASKVGVSPFALFNFPLIYCQGEPDFDLPTTSTNLYTGTWDVSRVSLATVGETTYTFTPDDNTICPEKITITVLPATSITVTDIAGCSGVPFDLTTAVTLGATKIADYKFYTCATCNGSDYTEVGNPTAVTKSQKGNYTYYARYIPPVNPQTDSCPSLYAPIHVNVTGPDTATMDVTCTAGEIEKIVITAPLGALYEYSIDGSPYQPSPVFNGLSGSSNYTVYVKDNNGCISVASALCPPCPDMPTITFTDPGSGILCFTPNATYTIKGEFTNTNTVYVTHNGTGTLDLATLNTSPFEVVYTPNVTDVEDTVTVVFTVSESSTCPEVKKSVKIAVNHVPTITVNVLGRDTAVCSKTTVSFHLENMITISTGDTFQRSLNRNFNTYDLSTVYDLNPGQSPLVYIRALSNFGCQPSEPDSIRLRVNPIPTVAVNVTGKDTVICSLIPVNIDLTKLVNKTDCDSLVFSVDKDFSTHIANLTSYLVPIPSNIKLYVKGVNKSTECETGDTDIDSLTIRTYSIPWVQAKAHEVSWCFNYPAHFDLETLVITSGDSLEFSTLRNFSPLVPLMHDFTVNPGETFKLYVRALNKESGCQTPDNEIDSLTISVKRYADATGVTFTGETTICRGTTTDLTAVAPAGFTNPVFNWFATATSTDTLYTGATYTTPALIADTTFYVTISSDEYCESQNRQGVNIHIDLKAPTVTISANQSTVCEGTSVTIYPSIQVGGSNPEYAWYVNGVLKQNGILNDYTYVPANNDSIYCVLTSNDPCAYPTTATSGKLFITVTPVPSVTVLVLNKDTSVCSNLPVDFLIGDLVTMSNGNELQFSEDKSFGTYLTTSTYTVPSGSSKLLYFRAKSDIARCPLSDIDSVRMTVSPVPAVAVTLTGKDTLVCSNTPVNFNLKTMATVTDGALQFSLSRSFLPLIDPNTLYPVNPNVSNKLYVRGLNVASGCYTPDTDIDSLTIRVYSIPSVAVTVAGKDTMVCSNTAQDFNLKTMATATNGDLQFSLARNFLTLIDPNTLYNVPPGSIKKLYVRAINTTSGCYTPDNAIDSVTIRVRPYADANDITVTGTTTICRGATTNLTATSSGYTNPVYRWYATAASTTVLYTGATYTTPALIADTTFYVTISDANSCESTNRKAVDIHVTWVKPTLTVGPNAYVPMCEGDTKTFRVTSTTNAGTNPQYEWEMNAVLIPGATKDTLLYTAPAASVNLITCWLTSNDPCAYPARVKADNNIMVTIFPVPSAPTLLTSILAAYPGDNVDLSTAVDIDPTLTYIYYATADKSGGPLSSSNVTFSPPKDDYYVTAKSGNCESPVSKILIKVPCPLTVTDDEGHPYKVSAVGGLCWTENLITTLYPGTSTPIPFAKPYNSTEYNDLALNESIFGLLYTWYSAVGVGENSSTLPVPGVNGYVQGICPTGWHIPSQVELGYLTLYQAKDLRSTNYWLIPGTNATGFDSRPAGKYDAATDRYINLYGYTDYWANDADPGQYASYLYLNYYCSVPEVLKTLKADGLSVRCVQDY